ncbi:acyl carrier protein [Myxococcota bacterium]|nr:acyl carrier protein [Myxococcota bacterium]MBU1898850.1 acyl carrier protein [Myxococcota bacterium]
MPLQRLQETFRDVFEDEALVITTQTTAADIEDWDSLMHVTLILAVEAEFGLRFNSGEISALKSIGDLVALIQRHQAE